MFIREAAKPPTSGRTRQLKTHVRTARAGPCVCSLIEHSRHLSNDTRAVNLHRCTHPMRGVLQARQLNRDEARRFKTYAALINIPRLYRKWLRLLLTRRAIARERPLHRCLYIIYTSRRVLVVYFEYIQENSVCLSISHNTAVNISRLVFIIIFVPEVQSNADMFVRVVSNFRGIDNR